MKILLELLGDACQLLAGLDDLSELRPESRERLKGLLQQLRFESSRLLEADEAREAQARAAEGPRRDEILQEALEALARERYDEAARALERGVARFPDDEEFFSYLGLIAWEERDFERAEAHYGQVVALCFPDELPPPEQWDEGRNMAGLRALEARALCLYRLGRFDEALPLFESLGSASREEFVGCRYLAGELRHLMGDVDGAIACYRGVPEEPAVLYNLALATLQRNELEGAASLFVRAFVSNVHVAALLLGRYSFQRGCMPGYLGSERYAEEFVEACTRLWHTVPESFAFMERCFDHPLVQSHLQQCAERGGEKLLSTPEGFSEQEGWQEQLHDQATVLGLARRVLQRLDA